MTPLESIVGIYKSKCGMRFDREAARALGLKEQTFNNYIKGRARMPDIAISKMAEQADIEPMQIIAAVNLSYKNTPEDEIEYWTDRYERTGTLIQLAATNP